MKNSTPLRWSYGIEWAQIEIELNKGRYYQGDELAGKLHLQGNGQERSIKEFNISLEATRYRTSGNRYAKATGTDYKRSIKIDTEIDLYSAKPLSLPFEFQIPKDICFTGSIFSWGIHIEFVRSNGSRTTVSRHFIVLPKKSFMDILKVANSDLGFQENLHVREWKKDSHMTRLYLEPDEQYKKQLDAILLEIFETEDGDIEGEFEFDLQEHKLTDYFRAAVGKDKVRLPIRIKRDDLYDENDQVKSETIADYLKEQINLALQRVV